jgi:hypothetical protein
MGPDEAFERIEQSEKSDAFPYPAALALGELRKHSRALKPRDPEPRGLVAHSEGIFDGSEVDNRLHGKKVDQPGRGRSGANLAASPKHRQRAAQAHCVSS